MLQGEIRSCVFGGIFQVLHIKGRDMLSLFVSHSSRNYPGCGEGQKTEGRFFPGSACVKGNACEKNKK